MYCTNDTVTIVHFDRESQGYICTVVHGASWASRNARYLNGTTEVKNTQTTVRIPYQNMPEGLQIHKDDFVCRGIVSGIQRRADLEQYERFCVTEIHDNRRGHFLQHWAVIGA